MAHDELFRVHFLVCSFQKEGESQLLGMSHHSKVVDNYSFDLLCPDHITG